MIGVLAVLVTGYYFYTTQIRQAGDSRPPLQQIDLVRVRSDLLSFAQSERLYLAANGNYGTLEQLRQSGNLSTFRGDGNREYSYEAEIDGASHFRITARPSSGVAGLPTLSIDETMQITP
jgi:hypothetical protein